MTDDNMDFRALVEKTPDADLLREMIGFAAQRLMEAEIESLTGAGHGAKCHDRRVQRNGDRDRDGRPALGTVELRIPKLRKVCSTSRANLINAVRPAGINQRRSSLM
jgi:transposase-like protein